MDVRELVDAPLDELCTEARRLRDEACGGLPNECVFLYPDQPGVCGTFCGDDYTCPGGYVCTQFQDATHVSLLCFPPGPSYSCP